MLVRTQRRLQCCFASSVITQAVSHCSCCGQDKTSITFEKSNWIWLCNTLACDTTLDVFVRAGKNWHNGSTQQLPLYSLSLSIMYKSINTRWTHCCAVWTFQQIQKFPTNQATTLSEESPMLSFLSWGWISQTKCDFYKLWLHKNYKLTKSCWDPINLAF